jgi:hypothetical protein
MVKIFRRKFPSILDEDRDLKNLLGTIITKTDEKLEKLNPGNYLGDKFEELIDFTAEKLPTFDINNPSD